MWRLSSRRCRPTSPPSPLPPSHARLCLQDFLRANCTRVRSAAAELARHDHLVLFTNSHDIYTNLATEEALLRALVLGPGQALLLCYVDTPCIVIGRNQNVLREVACRAAAAAGVALARRYSGGGAVYHDAGNLCLSFLTPRRDYAPEKTIQLVRHALCARYAIDPARLTTSHRHDLFLDGRKITGSAMRVQKDIALHHCTLLVDSVRGNVGRYLRPEGEYVEFASSATSSVPATVTTLQEEGLLLPPLWSSPLPPSSVPPSLSCPPPLPIIPARLVSGTRGEGGKDKVQVNGKHHENNDDSSSGHLRSARPRAEERHAAPHTFLHGDNDAHHERHKPCNLSPAHHPPLFPPHRCRATLEGRESTVLSHSHNKKSDTSGGYGGGNEPIRRCEPSCVMTAAVDDLRQSIAHFFLQHAGTILRHPTPWQLSLTERPNLAQASASLPPCSSLSSAMPGVARRHERTHVEDEEEAGGGQDKGAAPRGGPAIAHDRCRNARTEAALHTYISARDVSTATKPNTMTHTNSKSDCVVAASHKSPAARGDAAGERQETPPQQQEAEQQQEQEECQSEAQKQHHPLHEEDTAAAKMTPNALPVYTLDVVASCAERCCPRCGTHNWMQPPQQPKEDEENMGVVKMEEEGEEAISVVVPCELVWGEGRRPGSTESRTLAEEVDRLASETWRWAMPPFTTVIALTPRELRRAVRENQALSSPSSSSCSSSSSSSSLPLRAKKVGSEKDEKENEDEVMMGRVLDALVALVFPSDHPPRCEARMSEAVVVVEEGSASASSNHSRRGTGAEGTTSLHGETHACDYANARRSRGGDEKEDEQEEGETEEKKERQEEEEENAAGQTEHAAPHWTSSLHIRTTVDHRRITHLSVYRQDEWTVAESSKNDDTTNNDTNSNGYRHRRNNGGNSSTGEEPIDARASTTSKHNNDNNNNNNKDDDGSSSNGGGRRGTRQMRAETGAPVVRQDVRRTRVRLPWLEPVLQALLLHTACDAHHLPLRAYGGNNCATVRGSSPVVLTDCMAGHRKADHKRQVSRMTSCYPLAEPGGRGDDASNKKNKDDDNDDEEKMNRQRTGCCGGKRGGCRRSDLSAQEERGEDNDGGSSAAEEMVIQGLRMEMSRAGVELPLDCCMPRSELYEAALLRFVHGIWRRWRRKNVFDFADMTD